MLFPKPPGKGVFQQATCKNHSHVFSYVCFSSCHLHFDHQHQHYLHQQYLPDHLDHLHHLHLLQHHHLRHHLHQHHLHHLHHHLHYIIYINIMYIIFQELTHRRKTPIESGVNTQEKDSY